MPNYPQRLKILNSFKEIVFPGHSKNLETIPKLTIWEPQCYLYSYSFALVIGHFGPHLQHYDHHDHSHDHEVHRQRNESTPQLEFPLHFPRREKLSMPAITATNTFIFIISTTFSVISIAI